MMTPEERLELLLIDDDLLKYATAAEKQLYAQALDIESHLSGLQAYIQHVSPQTKAYAHLVLLCKWLDALLEGRLYYDGPGPTPIIARWEKDQDPDGNVIEIPVMRHPDRDDSPVYNLAIHEPPRHGKSYVVSEHFPAYFLTKYPEYGVILASYEDNFAASWGAKARDHIVDQKDFFGIAVKGGSNAAKGEWTIANHKGHFKAAGAGSSITGRGGQLLIVDDPVKNQEDAMSATIRGNQEDWWHSTFYNRRERFRNHDSTPGRVVFMCTRWHEDDLRGRVIDKQPGLWAILNLPSIWEPTDEEPVDWLGREPGMALCPQIMPVRELRQLQDASKIWFTAMYQGRPFIDDGNIIKKPFYYYDAEETVDGEQYTLWMPDGKRLYVKRKDTMEFGVVDFAASTKTTADWTVYGHFLITKTSPRYLVVRAIERIRIETTDHLPWLEKMQFTYRPQYILVEKATYGTNLINLAQRQNRLRVRPVLPDKDKVTRTIGTTVNVLGMRQLFFPRKENAPFAEAFERELLGFPNATHDDQADVLAYACQEFLNTPVLKLKYEDLGGSAGKAARLREKLANKDFRKRPKHPILGDF